MEILTGKIRQVEPDGVWIRVDMTPGQAARLCTKATDEAAVGFRDGRTISPEQRRKAWALMTDLGRYIGCEKDDVYDDARHDWLMSRKEELNQQAFRLSQASVTQAREFIDYLIGVLLADASRGGLQHLPQLPPPGTFPYDADVAAAVGQRGHAAEAIQQIGRAAAGYQLLPFRQPVPQRHQVNGLSFPAQLLRGPENGTMLRAVKVALGQIVQGVLAALQNRPQHGLFRIHVHVSDSVFFCELCHCALTTRSVHTSCPSTTQHSRMVRVAAGFPAAD